MVMATARLSPYRNGANAWSGTIAGNAWSIAVIAGAWAAASAAKKAAPPEQTNAENFYYQKQMQSRTPMVIVLRDGEEVHGIIEWYDRNCIKVNRENGEPNLMIYKPAIKYMFKEGENQG